MSTEGNATRPSLPGVERFREYLRRHSLSVQEFCEQNKHPALERTKVVRVLNGDRTRIGVDFARAIHEATRAEVPWWSWTAEGDSVEVLHDEAASPARGAA